MKKSIILALSVFPISSAMAFSEFTIQEVVPQEQVSVVAENIRKDLAPSGSKVSNPRAEGTMLLNDEGKLLEITLDQLQFDASFLFFSTKAKIKAHAFVPNGDCNSLYADVIEVTGTNSLMDSAIRSVISSKGTEIILNYLIKQTNLIEFCNFSTFDYTSF